MSATLPARGPEARAELERTIAAGGVALFPADGLYGLACDPLAPLAIERIQRSRPRRRQAFGRHVLQPLALRELLPSTRERSREALAALLPGPVTAVLANPPAAPARLPLDARGARRAPDRGPARGGDVPDLPNEREPLRRAAPAAFADVDAAIVAAVDLAIDGGELDRPAFDGRRPDAIEEGGPAAAARGRAAAGRTRAPARRSARLSGANPD